PWWRRYWMFIAWLLMLVLLGVMLGTIDPPEQTWWERIRSFAEVAFITALLLAGKAWYQRRRTFKWVERTVTDPQNRKLYLGWRRCSIGPEGVTCRQEEADMTLKWASVLKVAQDDEYLFLYTAAHTAIAVPRRPFASDAAFQKFVKAARAYWDM